MVFNDRSDTTGIYSAAATLQLEKARVNCGEAVDKILPYGCLMAGRWQMDAPWRKKSRTGGIKAAGSSVFYVMSA